LCGRDGDRGFDAAVSGSARQLGGNAVGVAKQPSKARDVQHDACVAVPFESR
jgi:hypothetical protein